MTNKVNAVHLPVGKLVNYLPVDRKLRPGNSVAPFTIDPTTLDIPADEIPAYDSASDLAVWLHGFLAGRANRDNN